jgi:serine/threonine protein kinase
MVGTPFYMAPESQEVGRVLTDAADIFAFGVMARELLGVATVVDAYPLGLLLAVNPAYPLEKAEVFLAATDRRLGGLLDQCLSVVPENRPSSLVLAEALAPYRYQAIANELPGDEGEGVVG